MSELLPVEGGDTGGSFSAGAVGGGFSAPAPTPATLTPPANPAAVASGGSLGMDTFVVSALGDGTHSQAFPSLPLQPSFVVELTALPANTKPCGASTVGPDEAKHGPHFLTVGGNPRVVRVRNLADIWIYAEVASEGVLAVIRKG